MGGAGRRIGLAAGLGALVLVAAAGVFVLLSGKRPRADLGTGGSSSARGPAERGGAAATGAGARGATGPAPVAGMTTRAETVTAEGDPELARALAEALLPHVARAGTVADALRAARAGEIDPVELGLRLHDAVGGRPELAHALVRELTAERDPAIALKIAQTLAGCLEDPGLRKATIDALAAAEPEGRAVGLLALLGRGEPEALALEARCFRDDAPGARATAGFLLNQAPGGVPEAHRADVLDAARTALRNDATEERVREEALGLLGRADMDGHDLGILERALMEGPSDNVRSRAFRALAESGAASTRVRPILERAAALPAMPEELRRAIRAYLTTTGR